MYDLLGIYALEATRFVDTTGVFVSFATTAG